MNRVDSSSSTSTNFHSSYPELTSLPANYTQVARTINGRDLELRDGKWLKFDKLKVNLAGLICDDSYQHVSSL
jgi:hypothetical protein